MSKSYLYYFMQSPMFVNEAVKCSMRTGLPKINRQDLNRIKINFPTSLDVQKEIVDTLEKWDTVIEKTEALINAKERRFGWLQKSALDDDFKSYDSHLCDYAAIMKQQKIEEVGDLKPLTVKLYCKGIEANERAMQITLSKKGRPYFQRFSGEFLIGRQSFHNGGFGIVPEQLDGFIASSAITTLEIDPVKLDPKYLFYFFSRKDYYLRIGHIMDGTVQKELSDKQIMKLPVSIPSIEKQKEVVALLDTVQQEIRLLKKSVDQYRTQKRGLMQKLLSGEWYIKNKRRAT
ncbi:MAG: restriction endonuclease subunit S [Chlamydiota bacterium]